MQEERVVDSPRPPGPSAAGRELIVFIHGLGRSRRCWWWLRRRFERAGFRTAAWTYPSLRTSIAQLGRNCAQRLATYDQDPAVATIHVVTHSLGGIILRQALTLAVPPTLGQVVMLAPPNRGSIWARRLGRPTRWLAPALGELSDAPDSFVNRLPPPPEGVTVTVIAAEKDGKCPLVTTHLRGEAAHRIVPGRHTFIMYRESTFQAIIQTFHQLKSR